MPLRALFFLFFFFDFFFFKKRKIRKKEKIMTKIIDQKVRSLGALLRFKFRLKMHA